MVKITKDLLIVGRNTNFNCSNSQGLSVLHACKHPCYTKKVGGQLHKNHPNYLYVETEHNLFLNIIDPPKPLFDVRLFTKSIKWIDKQIKLGRITVIHCNQGVSRSPSLALVWLASQRGISTSSYQAAANDFIQLYPQYNPGEGIKIFLTQHWKDIIPC